MGVEDFEDYLRSDSPIQCIPYAQVIRSINKHSTQIYGEDERYGNVFRFFLSSAYHAKQNDLLGRYAFVGQEATIAHLVNAFGLRVLFFWEGADDIDVVACDKGFFEAIAGSYDPFRSEKSNFRNRKISGDKWSIQLESVVYRPGTTDCEVIGCDVDLWQPEVSSPNICFGGRTLDNHFFSNLQLIPIFGIPVSVPDVYTLMDLRLNFASIMKEDAQMLMDLTTVLVAMGTDVEKYAESLDRRTARILKKEVYSCGNEKLRAQPIIVGLQGLEEIKTTLEKTQEFVERYCSLV